MAALSLAVATQGVRAEESLSHTLGSGATVIFVGVTVFELQDETVLKLDFRSDQPLFSDPDAADTADNMAAVSDELCGALGETLLPAMRERFAEASDFTIAAITVAWEAENAEGAMGLEGWTTPFRIDGDGCGDRIEA